MLSVYYSAPSAAGLDLTDPRALHEHLRSRRMSLERYAEELAHQLNQPRYIPGQSGESLAEDASTPSFFAHCLVYVNSTLSEARRNAAAYGWNICDGTSGTPDLRQRFLRGAPAGSGAGATGGCATISGYNACCTLSHTHTFSDFAAEPFEDGLNAGLASAGTLSAISVDHTHAGAETSSCAWCHRHGTSGTIVGGSNLPAYYDAIVIEKKC